MSDIKCDYCNGFGTVGRRISTHNYVGPGPVPEYARGFYEDECPACRGNGNVSAQDEDDDA